MMLIIIALIGAAAPTIAIITAHLLTRGQLNEIHLLVNSRLAAVTAKLEALEAVRDAEGEAAKKIVLDAAARGEHLGGDS